MAVDPLNELKNLKRAIEIDPSINKDERRNLTLATSLLINSYDGFIKIAQEITVKQSNGNSSRSACWLCDFVRVVVSMVVTSFAYAIVGAVVVGLVAVGVGAAPAAVLLAMIGGGIVGGYLGVAWAAYSYSAWDLCYGSINCGADDSDGFGNVGCTTGVCVQQ